MARIIYHSALDLPAVVYGYATSNTVVTFNNAMIEKFALADEKQQTLLRAIESQLLQRRLQPAQVILAIKKHFGLTEDQQKLLAKDILQEFCGSIRWWFDGLSDALTAIGSELPILNPFPVAQPKTSMADFMQKVRVKLDDAPKPVKQKIEAYVQDLAASGQCDEELVRKKLSSSITDGGFGLSQNRAGELVIMLTDVIGVYEFLDESAPPPLAPTVLTPAETAEVAEKKPIADELAAHPLSAAEQLLLENTMQKVPLEGVAPELQERYRMIVSAHMGGLRDADQTRALLAAPESGGGMGLSEDQAFEIAGRVHKAVTATTQKRAEMVVMEKIAHVEQQAAALEAQSPERQSAEKQKQLNEQFVTLFGRDAVANMRAIARREIQTPEAAHPQEKQHSAPAVEPTLAPPSQPSQPPKYVPKIPDKLKAMIDADHPIFPLAKKAPDAAVPPTKKSSDIKSAPRLLGPIDELRTMTIVDFRRLSDESSVRIQKIRSKMEVVATQGAREKMEALAAFEQSEPACVYRELLNQSLREGKSVAELCVPQEKGNDHALTADELSAISSFLQHIRYAS